MRSLSLLVLSAVFCISSAAAGLADDQKPVPLDQKPIPPKDDKKPIHLNDVAPPIVPKGYSLDLKTDKTPSVADAPPAALVSPKEPVLPYVGLSISKPLNEAPPR